MIVDAVRTPIGRAHKGSLVDVRPEDLLARVIARVLEPHDGVTVDEVVAGCGYPWGEQGFNVARAGTLLAGLPDTTPAFTVSRLCASSLQAIRSTAHAIALGEGDVYVAAGVESVSRVGRDRHLYEPHPRLSGEGAIADYYMPMIDTAEEVARRFDVTREQMDVYAQRSQERAVAAQRSGHFAREIVPVDLPGGGRLEHDEGPRPTSSLEKLAELQPVTGPGGSITAGNSCPLNDGAAAVLLMSAERCRELGVQPRARIVASAATGVAPEIMGVGPIEAVKRALARAGLTMDDIDAIELNEAFAAQVIPCAREWGIDTFDERLNPHGGAIALGHPFGMTGARVMTALLNDLDVLDGRYGIETMCVGGGQGQAMVVERLAT